MKNTERDIDMSTPNQLHGPRPMREGLRKLSEDEVEAMKVELDQIFARFGKLIPQYYCPAVVPGDGAESARQHAAVAEEMRVLERRRDGLRRSIEDGYDHRCDMDVAAI